MADRSNFHAMFQAVGGDDWKYADADDDVRHLRQGWAPTVLAGARFISDALTGYEHPEWMASAGCAGLDDEYFFAIRVARTVRRICCRCEVADECLAYALADEDLAGFWAGTTARDRMRIRAGRDGASKS